MPTRRLISLLALLGALLLPATASAVIAKPTREKLHDKAIAAAKALKENHPTNLVAVRTTYGKVKSAFGSGPSRPPASTPVYLIYMKGRFHSGGKIHTRYNLVVRAKTLKQFVAYFDEQYPDELGDPTRI